MQKERCDKRLALERIVYSNAKNRHLPEWRFFFIQKILSQLQLL